MRLQLFLALLVPLGTAWARPATFRATDFGAVGDGATLDTAFLQKAIDTCSTHGGGTLILPAGRYLTGTIELKDNVTLHLDDQAVLVGSTHSADYRNVDPFIDGTGRALGYALVAAVGVRHVGIDGPGTIDGQGKALAATERPYTVRPFLVRWVRCTDITVADVHLRNSGAWTMNFFRCRNATIDRVTIRSHGLPNNDGIDIDSGEAVRIRDCDIESGDDSLCLKATSAQPCRDIHASGCTLKSDCNAIKLGTESLGDFAQIHVENCQIRDTHLSGIALYSVDGSHLHDVTLNDIVMAGVTVPISIRLGARLRTFRAGDSPRTPGILRDIVIRNIRATGARQIGILINGLPGHPVEKLRLENIEIGLIGGGTSSEARVEFAELAAAYPEITMFGKVMPASGIYVRHVRGISFRNVQTTVAKPDGRPAVVLIDVADLDPADFLAGQPRGLN